MPKSVWPALPIAIALVLGGCASPAETASATAVLRPEGARLTTAEAIRIATDVAKARGINLSKFSEPIAHYKPGTWVILFDGTEHKHFGDHFGVVIDDDTGGASFQGGA